jgi:hypothetical protein
MPKTSIKATPRYVGRISVCFAHSPKPASSGRTSSLARSAESGITVVYATIVHSHEGNVRHAIGISCDGRRRERGTLVRK